MSDTSEDTGDLEALEGELDAAGGDAGRVDRARLTDAEWERVKALWESGTVKLRELAEEFGVRIDSLQKRLKAEGVVKGARAYEQGEAVREKVKSDAERQVERIGHTKEQHYQYTEALAKLTMQTVLDARSGHKSFGSVDADLAALGKAMKVIALARQERYALLGLDKEDANPDELPELLVSELTPDQIEKIRRGMEQNHVDDGLDEIEVLS